MKRNEFIFRIIIISIPVIALLTAISLSVAWYIHTIRTGSIDASTKNVSLSYTLTTNGTNTKTNEYVYSIDNLAFFDIDNSDETSYFNQMACELSLTLTNVSNSAMTYTVTFRSAKIVVEDENENVISRSFVACYYQNNPSGTISSLATNGTVSGNTIAYSNTDQAFTVTNTSPTGALSASGEVNDSVTFTLYLIGVQDIDEATNTDFLYTESAGNRSYTNHPFTITITAEPISNSAAEENED